MSDDRKEVLHGLRQFIHQLLSRFQSSSRAYRPLDLAIQHAAVESNLTDDEYDELVDYARRLINQRWPPNSSSTF
jgi:hypothetical protein